MAININTSLMNPNQRGLWSSASMQMDTWDFGVPHSHPPSPFRICLENSKHFKQNHRVTRENIIKPKLKESLSCTFPLPVWFRSVFLEQGGTVAHASSLLCSQHCWLILFLCKILALHIHLGQRTVLKQICVAEAEILHQEVCRREKKSQR